MPTVGDILLRLQGIDPTAHIHLGSRATPVARVLVTPQLTAPPAAPDSMVVSPRPVIPLGCASLNEDAPLPRLAAELVRRSVAVCLLGSGFLESPEGAHGALADAIGLVNAVPLVPAASIPRKLVTFVPPAALQAVTEALAAAGAGVIGRYSHCTFRGAGTGTYLPLEGAEPYAGEVGRLEEAEEVRLETVVPAHLVPRVVSALLAAHPYEEVAYDVYPLVATGGAGGVGRVGELKPPRSVADLARDAGGSVVAGQPAATAERVAVVAGAATAPMVEAAAGRAQLLLTGRASDQALYVAAVAGLPVVEVGYDMSMRPALARVAKHLRGPDAVEVIGPD